MNYSYNPEGITIMGYYRCDECGATFSAGKETGHADNCIGNGNEDRLTFVFGPDTARMIKSKATLLGDDDAVSYGGLTLKKLKEIFPESLG